MLNNNFSCAQLSFLFLFQKDLYYVHDDNDVVFLFPLQTNFDIFLELLFEAFLCVFDNIFKIFIYTKKLSKKLLVILVLFKFSTEFSSSKFSLLESEEISILPVINLIRIIIFTCSKNRNNIVENKQHKAISKVADKQIY